MRKAANGRLFKTREDSMCRRVQSNGAASRPIRQVLPGVLLVLPQLGEVGGETRVEEAGEVADGGQETCTLLLWPPPAPPKGPCARGRQTHSIEERRLMQFRGLMATPGISQKVYLDGRRYLCQKRHL